MVDHTCGDPKSACIHGGHRTLREESPLDRPGSVAASRLLILAQYLTNGSPIPTDRGSRRCTETSLGAGAGTRAAGGTANGGAGLSLGHGYGSCKTVRPASRESVEELRATLPVTDRPTERGRFRHAPKLRLPRLFNGLLF
jgi:hypothetical protein